MRIGLRSVDGTYNMNFGSSLQCFAMYTFLRELFPQDEIVYLSWWSKNQKLDPTISEKSLYGKLMKSTCDPYCLDKCVIGSDCIMYFNECDDREILDVIFLCNGKIDKILYSVGSANLQNKITLGWKDYLSKMEYVSVRDIDNQRFIPNSIVSIDPTLLFDETWWSNQIAKPVDMDIDEIRETSITYCPWFEKDNTKWFKKPNGCMECYKNESIKSPFEFLWVVKNCKEIHSYSFHAFIFSLIFNKHLFIHNAYNDFKLTNLMKMLNIHLEDGRFVNRDEVLTNIINQRKSSEIYLKYMIGKGMNK